MRNAYRSLAALLADNPNVAKELAQLLGQSNVVKARTASKMANFGELRRYGSAIFDVLNHFAEEARDVAHNEGLTLTNQWRFNALAMLSKELYPVARDAWGIPALAPVKEATKPNKVQDWRRSLVEIDAQEARTEKNPGIQAVEPAAAEPDENQPATDARE